MSYCELKVQNKPIFNGNVDKFMNELVMTLPRDQVPILMDGRVPLAVWTATYDKVIASYRIAAEEWAQYKKSPLTYMPFILPCLLPVFLPFICVRARKMNQKTRDHQQAFSQMATEQAAIYRQYSVQVSLAKELVSHGVGSDRHMSNEVVGLRFDVVVPIMAVPQPPPTAVVVAAPASYNNYHQCTTTTTADAPILSKCQNAPSNVPANTTNTGGYCPSQFLP